MLICGLIRRRRRQAAPGARGRRRRHTLERLNRHLAVIAIAVEAHLGKSRPIVVLAALVLLAHLALVPLPAGVLHRALVAVHLEGFHDADARRPVPDDLVGHAAPNELIKVDAAHDLPGLGVLVQLVRRRLLPRLRRLRCCLSHPRLLLPASSARSRRRRHEPCGRRHERSWRSNRRSLSLRQIKNGDG